MKYVLTALVLAALTLAVLAPLSGAFVVCCGLLVLAVPLYHLGKEDVR